MPLVSSAVVARRRCANVVLLVALLFPPGAGAQSTLPQTSVDAYVAALKASLPGAGSNAYVQPSQADADAFRGAIARLLDGEVLDAMSRLGALNYDLAYLVTSGGVYLVASERSANFGGRGTFIVSPRYERNLAVEVPHPLFDTNTAEEGGRVFSDLGARLLAIAGTHRCANGASSGCSGTTSVCSPGTSQSYRVSDMAHSAPGFFQAAHEAAAGTGMRAMNLHGNSSEVPDVEISDGTKATRSSADPVNRFRDALAARGVSVASCNWPADDPASLNLCGTTNVQGRFTNGSPDPCGAAAQTATGTFLHIEQHRNIRDEPSGLIAAAAAVIPRDPAAMPRITSLLPASATAGSPQIALAIEGSGFHPGAIASAGGAVLPTEFAGAGRLTTTIPASMLATPGTIDIVVANLDRTVTGSRAFAVTAAPFPAPSVLTISPSVVAVGSGSLTLSVQGTGFVSGSQVFAEATPLATTLVRTDEVTALMPASLFTAPARLMITVVNPGDTSSDPVPLRVVRKRLRAVRH